MSTLEDLEELEREERDKKDQGDGDGRKPDGGDGDADMGDAEKKDEGDELLDDEILNSSTADIVKRRRMLENELRIMKSEFQRLTHEQSTMREKVKDNQEKIENNRYVVLKSSHPIPSLGVTFCDGGTTPGPRFSRLIMYFFPLSTDNYHTWSEMSSSCWIWMSRLRQPRKGPTSTWTQPGSASLPSSKRPPAKPSIYRSSVS